MNLKNYKYINSLKKLKELDEILMSNDTPRFKILAYDTETNGLRLNNNYMVGFSISTSSEDGYYVPLLEWVPENTVTKRKKKGRLVHPYLKDLAKNIDFEKFQELHDFKINRSLSKNDKGDEEYTYEFLINSDGQFKSPWTGKTYKEFFSLDKEIVIPEIKYYLNRWLKSTNLIMHNAPFDINMTYSLTDIDLTDNLFLDTQLLAHVINSNLSTRLKDLGEIYKNELGIAENKSAKIEQKELAVSVFLNGGTVTKSWNPKSIWRGAPKFIGKYAAMDTCLTYALHEVFLKKLVSDFGEKGVKWVFEDEVMPLCKEVVIPMKRNGVRVDVQHFNKLKMETWNKLLELEDKFRKDASPHIQELEDESLTTYKLSEKVLILKLIELEKIEIPSKIDSKTGLRKQSFAKNVVKSFYQKNPHWIYGYILGEDEIPYSDEKLQTIKNEIFNEKEGRRYAFNLNSSKHLTKLFCDKLKLDKTTLPQTDLATKTNPIPKMDLSTLKDYIIPKFPWAKTLILYSKLSKLYTSYILPVINLHVNEIMYMDMKQTGTISGRFACSGGFNLQTLPRVEELDKCFKCNSENVTVNNIIELIGSQVCNDCGNITEEILCSSAIKKGFIAPPNSKIINADYASLEPRIFAFISKEDKIKEIFYKGYDFYSKFYCDIFDKENKYSPDPKDKNFLKKIDSKLRALIKPIVLAIPYGALEGQVANMMGFTKSFKNDQEKEIIYADKDKGKKIISEYLTTYKNLHNYMTTQEIKAMTEGEISSLYGRKLKFKYAKIIGQFLFKKGVPYQDFIKAPTKILTRGPNIYLEVEGLKFSFNYDELYFLLKKLNLDYNKVFDKEKGTYWKFIRNLLKSELDQAKNWPIQTVAGHVANRAMLEMARGFKANNLNASIFLQVHDEISAYSNNNCIQKAKHVLQSTMENNLFTKLIDVPMIAQPLICDNLKDSK